MISTASSRVAGAFAAAALAVSLIPGFSPAAEALRAPQVTKAEFKKVKQGMTPAKVKSIVGARGRITARGDGGCVIRRYSGWGDQTVYIRWESDNGKVGVTEKVATIGDQFPTPCFSM